MLRQFLRLKLAGITAFSMLFTPMAAHADFTVCNGSPNPVWVIVNHPNSSGSYTARGWYKVASRKCTTPYTGRANNRQFSIYAKSAAENYYWDGDALGCFSENKITSPWSSCEGNGGKMERRFLQVDVGNYRNYTYTIWGSLSGDAKLDILPSELSRIKRQRDIARNNNTGNDNSGAGLAAAAALLGLFIWSQDARRKNEEDACMSRCTRSKSRCYELCTQ